MQSSYPIGTPGQAWSDSEKQQWRDNQHVQRSYQQQVVDKLAPLTAHYDVLEYGALPYDPQRYRLLALKSRQWQEGRPVVLVTGGVHGYETSGVQGAIAFAEQAVGRYLDKINLLVVPCISPWGYETINRWDPLAVDPNRNFIADSPAPEAAQFLAFMQSLDVSLTAHFDLHETTDTDNSEFRPALAARDGVTLDVWDIPDGFYLVADSAKVNLPFQQAIIHAVEAVTHIAPSDDTGRIIGEAVLSEGVIKYDKSALGLCGGFSDALYVTTTEVYPDSPSATPEICIAAQVAAVSGGLDYILTQL